MILIAAIVVGAVSLFGLLYVWLTDGYREATPDYMQGVPVLEAESGDPLLRDWQARIDRTSPADWQAVGDAFAAVAPSLNRPAAKGWNKSDAHLAQRRAALHQMQKGRGK